MPARPTTKYVRAIAKSTLSNTEETTTLFTAGQAGTITGMRWEMTASDASELACLIWAIVLVPNGVTEGTLGSTDGVDFYPTPSRVLTYGIGFVLDSTETAHFSGSIRTSQKLQEGDKIMWIGRTTSAAGHCELYGNVQFFFLQ